MSYDLPLETIQAAHQRIAPYIRHTPLLPLPPLRDDLPSQLRLKLENLQVVGSFKARGAFNNLLQLDRSPGPDGAKRRRACLANLKHHAQRLLIHRVLLGGAVFGLVDGRR